MSDSIEHLNSLEMLDLILLKKNDPELEYAFKHVFTQESVYDSLLRSDRRQLHLKIGETLEATGAQDGDTILMLAHHFKQGGDTEKALTYLTQAANSAAAAYANQEAKALFEEALELVKHDDYAQRWELLADLEQTLDRLGARTQQANTLTQMQTLAQLMQDDERLAATHNRRSAYFDKVSEYRAAAEAAEVSLRIARRSNNEHLQAQSLNLLALAAWRRFDYPQVQNWAQQALDALRIVGDPRTRVTSLFHLGKASYRLGQYDQALHYIQAAEELTRDTDNRDGEATSHMILGWIYQRLGEYDRAEQHYQNKLAVRRAIGSRYGEATALSHLGWLANDQLRPEAGLEYCRQALEISYLINDRENEAYAQSGLGLNYELLGRATKAAEHYNVAWRLHDEIGATTLAIFDQAGLARIALHQDDLATAEAMIKPVYAWISAGNAQKFWDPWTIYLTTHRVLLALGRTDDACAVLVEAHTLLRQRAQQISSETLRHCFLTEVEVNREIEAGYRTLVDQQ